MKPVVFLSSGMAKYEHRLFCLSKYSDYLRKICINIAVAVVLVIVTLSQTVIGIGFLSELLSDPSSSLLATRPAGISHGSIGPEASNQSTDLEMII